MLKAGNQRNLRDAVHRLARADVSEADVSRAIDCFGQVLADLTETPLRLAVITDEAFDENNELRAEVVKLQTEIRLLRAGYPADVVADWQGFKIVKDPTLAPNEIKAVCATHNFLNGTCTRCGLVHWSE